MLQKNHSSMALYNFASESKFVSDYLLSLSSCALARRLTIGLEQMFEALKAKFRKYMVVSQNGTRQAERLVRELECNKKTITETAGFVGEAKQRME